MYLTTMAAIVVTTRNILEKIFTGGLLIKDLIGNWVAVVVAVVLFVAALFLAYDVLEPLRDILGQELERIATTTEVDASFV